MLDFAVNSYGFDADDFFGMFINQELQDSFKMETLPMLQVKPAVKL